MITWNDVASVITAIVALVSLGISIYILIIQRKEKKPKIRLRIKQGGLVYGDKISEYMVIITVANHGFMATNLVSLIATVNNKATMIFRDIEGTARFPFDLEPNKSADFWIPYLHLVNLIQENGFSEKVHLDFICSDAIGNKYQASHKINIGKEK